MAKVSSKEPPCDKLDLSGIAAVGPVPRPWREGTLTRATELQALSSWVLAKRCLPKSPPEHVPEDLQALVEAIKIIFRRPRMRLRERSRLSSKIPPYGSTYSTGLTGSALRHLSNVG